MLVRFPSTLSLAVAPASLYVSPTESVIYDWPFNVIIGGVVSVDVVVPELFPPVPVEVIVPVLPPPPPVGVVVPVVEVVVPVVEVVVLEGQVPHTGLFAAIKGELPVAKASGSELKLLTHQPDKS